MQRLVYVLWSKKWQSLSLQRGHSHCMAFPHDRSKTVCFATLQQKQNDDGDFC